MRKREIQAAVVVRVEEAAMETDEVLEELSKVARLDPRESAGSAASKVRALEILARIHGLMNDRLNIELNRETLLRNIDEQLLRLAEIAVRDGLAGEQRLALPAARGGGTI